MGNARFTPTPSRLAALALTLGALALGALTVAGLGGCTKQTRTQVLVEIEADTDVRDELARVRIIVRSELPGTTTFDPVAARDEALVPTRWPMRILLAPRDGHAERRYEFIARAESGAGVTLTEARAISGYVEGQVRVMRLRLESACRGVTCDPTMACRAGLCADAEIPADQLRPYGEPDGGGDGGDGGSDDGGPRSDAGSADAGSADAGSADAGSADAAPPIDTSLPATFAKSWGISPGGEERIYTTALSNDGSRLVLGRCATTVAPAETGAAWIYQRTGGTWNVLEGGTLIVGAAPDRFGCAVAISDRGDEAYISDPNASFVYQTTPGEAMLTSWRGATDTMVPGFGLSVAVSADGNRVVIGAPHALVPEKAVAWVFTRSRGAWSMTGIPLNPASAQRDVSFGSAVAISGDGQRILVGAPLGPGGSSDVFSGSATLFRVDASGLWEIETSWFGDHGGSGFGSAVALDYAGTRALVGAPSYTGEGPGEAWAFERERDHWQTTGAPLRGSTPPPGDRFGASVALSRNGNLALIGAPGERSDAGGTVYTYQMSAGDWTPLEPIPAPSSHTLFGASLALSPDMQIAAIGSSQGVQVYQIRYGDP